MIDPKLSLSELLKHISPEYKRKIIRAATEFGIKRPVDFCKVPKSSFTKIHGCGEGAFVELLIAMNKCGIPYSDDDNIEKLKNRRERHSSRNGGQSKESLRIRFKILKRDNFRCRYCGRGPADDDSVVLNVDHIRPVSAGGKYVENNLITSCRECNIGKSDKVEIDPKGFLETYL